MGTPELNTGKIQELDIITEINHELRTPLTISKEGVLIILDKIPGDINKEQEKLLLIIKNSLERLAGAIEKLPAIISGHRDSLT